MMSHRPLNRKSPQMASRSSEKWQKHSKHTTGNGLQTLFRFLGKLTIYILDRISAPYKQLTLRFGKLWTKRRLCLKSTSQLGKTVISNCLTRQMYLGFRPLPSELPFLHKRSAPKFVLVRLKQESRVSKIIDIISPPSSRLKRF